MRHPGAGSSIRFPLWPFDVRPSTFAVKLVFIMERLRNLRFSSFDFRLVLMFATDLREGAFMKEPFSASALRNGTAPAVGSRRLFGEWGKDERLCENGEGAFPGKDLVEAVISRESEG